MKIIRAPRPDHYQILPTAFLRDESLSYRARGVAARILSNVDGYACTSESLARQSPREGRKAILGAMDELRVSRYLIVTHTQGARGHWETQSMMFDAPQPKTALCCCKKCQQFEARQAALKPKSPEGTSVTEIPSRNFGPPNFGRPESGGPTFGQTHAKSSSTSNIITRTTTTTPEELAWPFQLDQEQVVVVWQKFEYAELSVELRQDVLDEFAGRHRIGSSPRQPMSWLSKTIEKAAKGEFVLDAGLIIQRERRQRQTAEAERLQREKDRAAADAKRNDPEQRARNNAAARKAAEEINGKGSSDYAFATP